MDSKRTSTDESEKDGFYNDVNYAMASSTAVIKHMTNRFPVCDNNVGNFILNVVVKPTVGTAALCYRSWTEDSPLSGAITTAFTLLAFFGMSVSTMESGELGLIGKTMHELMAPVVAGGAAFVVREGGRFFGKTGSREEKKSLLTDFEPESPLTQRHNPV